MTNNENGTGQDLRHPQTVRAFREMRLLTGGYLALSWLTMGAAFLLRHHHSMVTSNVWVRGGIVAIASAVSFALARRAAQGSRGAYRRLRILSAVMVVAVVVIVSLPGFLPMWMRIEQAVCGLLLLRVVVIAAGGRMRTLFAAK
ncbi:hypothetical protein [Actinomadura verrucosospora]|uniref:Membrane protein n=1 Tax=Actinomadura verrucosospora TaxID=46165 RepID=A0A7D3ZK09_ACTVE|nr:hypothetical protein [Actinomadura verrucosospora]QKG20263.1 membrane protein [Actinomadura verrucosospora]